MITLLEIRIYIFKIVLLNNKYTCLDQTPCSDRTMAHGNIQVHNQTFLHPRQNCHLLEHRHPLLWAMLSKMRWWNIFIRILIVRCLLLL